MKNYLKTSKWLRWMAAGAFGVMLVLNVMVSLDFEKDKALPSLTLAALGNIAYNGGGEAEQVVLSGRSLPVPLMVVRGLPVT